MKKCWLTSQRRLLRRTCGVCSKLRPTGLGSWHSVLGSLLILRHWAVWCKRARMYHFASFGACVLACITLRLSVHACSHVSLCVFSPRVMSPKILWGGSKWVSNFSRNFYAMRSLVPVGHFRNISGHLFTRLVCGSFQWRHGLLFTECIVWDDKEKVIDFKRSHWIHLGWWSTRSPKLQLFQLSQHSHVTNCRLISFSAYFLWKMTWEYKMQLSEGSWDKFLHSTSRTQCFSKEEKNPGGLSLEAIHQSSGSSFRDFFLKTTKES